MTAEIYEAVIRELGLRLAQAEIDKAFAQARAESLQQRLPPPPPPPAFTVI